MESIGIEGDMIKDPCIAQIERMMDSVQKLTLAYIRPTEEVFTLSQKELRRLGGELRDRVCVQCKNQQLCSLYQEKAWGTYVREWIATLDEYGNELTVELNRFLQRNCVHSDKLKEELIHVFEELKEREVWKLKLNEKEQECALVLRLMTDSIADTAKNLGDSLYEDDRIQKAVRKSLQKIGIRVVKYRMFLNEGGHFIVRLTMRTRRGTCVPMGDVVGRISDLMGRKMVASSQGPLTVGEEYDTYTIEENPSYRMLYGVAKKKKAGSEESGDQFLVLEQSSDRIIALVDGMGSGAQASQVSRCMVEHLEDLILAGFPMDMAASMVNETMVLSHSEVAFSTLDMCQCDLFTGSAKLLKAGTPPTYIKSGSTVHRYLSSGLPLGSMEHQRYQTTECNLKHGDYIVMMTDGVEEVLPEEQRAGLLDVIIGGRRERNPKKMAAAIMDQVVKLGGEKITDDMMVLVAGIWKS